MEDVIALIDRIIEEHKTFLQRLQTLEQVANDAEALAGLEKAQETFMPGRLEHHETLQNFKSQLDTVAEGLEAHFSREETRLLAAFEKYADQKLAQALRSLLLEHDDLRRRFASCKNQVAELMSGKLSSHAWGATAHDMRAYTSHTRKLLEAHALIEQEMLRKLRDEMEQASK